MHGIREASSKTKDFWRNALRDGINIQNMMCVEKKEREKDEEEKKEKEKVNVGAVGPPPDMLPPSNLKEAERSLF